MTAVLATEQIRAALRKVVEPEVGANIVDLGLIYRIELDGSKLLIEMTMTSPACPMGEMIVDDAYAELDRILPTACQLGLGLDGIEETAALGAVDDEREVPAEPGLG